MDYANLRNLYRQACFGAGAAARWEARDQLDAVAKDAGFPVRQVIEYAGGDLTTYFATRPISR